MFFSASASAKMANDITRMKMAKEKAKMVKLGLMTAENSSLSASSSTSNTSPNKKTSITKPKWAPPPKKPASSICIPAKTTRSAKGSSSATQVSDVSLLDEDFSALLDINKSDVDKAEAKHDIRLAIDSTEGQLFLVKEQMESDRSMAIARYESAKRTLGRSNVGNVGSPKGSILSMKKFKRHEREYKRLRAAIAELSELSTSIQLEEVKPNGYKEKIIAIVEAPVPHVDLELPADQILLQELESFKVAATAKQ